MPRTVQRNALRGFLREIGLSEGALVMAHTSVLGLSFSDEQQQSVVTFPAIVAGQLVDDLLDLLAPSGTLVMPTHAAYQQDEQFDAQQAAGAQFVYDPTTTPCGVGLANELFRRRRGVLRSRHPYNALAALGPLAEELMAGNLNRDKPLPHGIHSSYYRFCQHNGLVVSIGLPLGPYMTLIHAAEEVRDDEWPIKDFFVERTYRVRIDGRDEPYVVRQHRSEYQMFCKCSRAWTRDLKREGILHSGRVGALCVDWARAGEVFQYFMTRNRNSTYPYFWPHCVRKTW